jgi:hypothetical protein
MPQKQNFTSHHWPTDPNFRAKDKKYIFWHSIPVMKPSKSISYISDFIAT